MEKILDNVRFKEIESIAEEAKKQGNKIIWERDGSHGVNDLQIILEFEKLGFSYKIYNYKGQFEKNAIKVEFSLKAKSKGGLNYEAE